MNIYKFSYDNKDDAIRSLANYYQVTDKEILSMSKSLCDDLNRRISKIGEKNGHLMGVREKEYKEKIEFEKMNFLKEIENTLNFNALNEDCSKIRISFYHRCASDGKDSWFKEELLNSVDGIECFWNKLISLVPDVEKMGISLVSLKKEIRQKGWYEEKSEKSEKDGINGFYRFKDAIHNENSGFDIPEIFDDFFGYERYQELKAKILTVLKLTVVKFYVERDITELNEILRKYWEFVWNDEGIGNTGEDAGRGKTIPFENIERIDYLENLSNA